MVTGTVSKDMPYCDKSSSENMLCGARDRS